MSTILGTVSLVSLGVAVFLAYQEGGEAAAGLGVAGILALLYSLVGIVLGVRTVREKNYYRLFPVLGTLLNLAALGGISLILYAGQIYNRHSGRKTAA